jgi:hypothetical protein
VRRDDARTPCLVHPEICYRVARMSKRTFTKRKVATPDLDPTAAAQQRMADRLRKQASATLLKRRRRKSGQ